ncbi:reverse transcriptase domain-containing protein [Tanacetum coccineum]|uniref:Reverse transcriptase domain-containing protein n=1 Tax=Tanacetum coccineum TaxID=301880 RepID=A0ABQ5FNN1_9ASTR
MTKLTLEESLSMFMVEIAKRHDEHSNLIKEIQASTDFALRNQKTSIKALEIQSKKITLPSLNHLNDDYGDELKESDGEKDLEAHYTNVKPLSKALPRKEKDPGSFTLPCFFNNMCFNKALADLGASVSVMPYSTYTTIGLRDLFPTKLIVELADRIVKQPKGITENVLVGIDKFTLPVSFIILDISEDFKTP